MAQTHEPDSTAFARAFAAFLSTGARRFRALVVGGSLATHNHPLVLQPTDQPFMQLEGIYTPLITPFRRNFSPDYDAYGAAIDWQADNGVHGLIVGGSTGECYALTTEERIEQLQFAARMPQPQQECRRQ